MTLSICTDDSNRTALCFREILTISLKDNFANNIKQIGGCCIHVEPIGPQDHKFLVHMHSSMTIDDYFGGTKLVSLVMGELQCLKEKHTEYIL